MANFGDGKINAYDTCSGQWLGALADTDGKDLVLPGLWALRAGNGHNGGEAGLLYFTAGIPGRWRCREPRTVRLDPARSAHGSDNRSAAALERRRRYQRSAFHSGRDQRFLWAAP